MGVRQENPQVLAAMIQAISDIFPLFKDNFFIEFGTLLGAVRDGKMIPWDSDIDIGVFREHVEPRHFVLLREQKFIVTAKNHKTKHTESNITTTEDLHVISVKRNRVPVQIHIYDPMPGGKRGCKTHAYTITFPEDVLSPLTKITLEGIECNCPVQPERLLELTYGDGWRIPRKKFGSDERKYRIKFH